MTYIVTAEDEVNTQSWIVTVATASNTETDIISFNLPQQTSDAVIYKTNHRIEVEVASGADVTSLTPVIEISDGAIVSPASGVTQDFTTPVRYMVTAEDGITVENWSVAVNLEKALGWGDGDPSLIYPNPTENNITITEENFEQAIVSDFLGREILTSDMRKLDLRDLSSGVYFITIRRTKEKQIIERVIKR